jgi:hypothetical protein
MTPVFPSRRSTRSGQISNAKLAAVLCEAEFRGRPVWVLGGVTATRAQRALVGMAAALCVAGSADSRGTAQRTATGPADERL